MCRYVLVLAGGICELVCVKFTYDFAPSLPKLFALRFLVTI